MRALLLLVLFCTLALQWDPVSCQKSVYRFALGNVWSSDRPSGVTLNRNGDEVSWTKISSIYDHRPLQLNQTTKS